MCHPIVAMLLTVATTVYSTSQANAASDAQAKALKAKDAANMGALDDKSEEITESANIERFERKKQLQREVATTRAAQSEGGALFGTNALRIMASKLIGGGQDVALIDKQSTNLQRQVTRQREGSAAGTALNLSSLNWTSPLMTGLAAGTSGANAYMDAGGDFGKPATA